MAKLWGGRFEKEPDKLLWAYNASIDFDWRMYEADIHGSIAYARGLKDAGVLTPDEAKTIVDGLGIVLGEFESGAFVFAPSDEDIHTAVERRLHELKGDVAGKLHTGRSRNDQVATDTRLYLLGKIGSSLEKTARRAVSTPDGTSFLSSGDDAEPKTPHRGASTGLRGLVRDLQDAIVDQAEVHLDAMMPGYTHLQPAQPILFSHWLMSFFWMLQRDVDRLDALTHHVAVMPLGSAALAGNTFDIDREMLAADLGFETVSQNSLDAVADRDFIAEFLFWAALLQTHLSRMSEDLILYATAEFGFVELDDAYSTGSSIMPQKKNPDPLELARGKTGRMVGNLVALLTTLKGLPSAYDKDLQEDKEPLFDAIDTLEIELPVLTGAIATLKVKADRMAAALGDELLATDLADHLVRRAVPFRESHRLVGQAVRRAL
ncbi:MAG: argininosuccinate lyase, partial [Anaerolineae bacterium]|nr:argininosuccinate lyase [Anaerolineae bacterium]